MTRLVSSEAGIGRLADDDTIDLLEVPAADLSEAFRIGLTVLDLAKAPIRENVPASGVTLLAPVPHPSKIWAVGFGYHAHREEVGFESEPTEPVIFLKAPSSLTATCRPIRLPAVAPNEVDYEGELGVVIGTRLSAADTAMASASLAGYTVCNDVSARDVQKGRIPGRQPDVSAAKSFDTFTPSGPCLVTLDELADPNDLQLRTWVDGELRQDARTSDLITSVPTLVAYLSHQTTLEPGDLILTGTPGGVGHKRGLFLRRGNEIRVEIEGVGALVNTCA